MVDEDDLVGPEQPLGDGEGPDERRRSRPRQLRMTWESPLGEPEHAVGVRDPVQATTAVCTAGTGGHRPCRSWRRTVLATKVSVLLHGSSLETMICVPAGVDRFHSHASLMTWRIRNIRLTSGFTGARLDPRAGYTYGKADQDLVQQQPNGRATKDIGQVGSVSAQGQAQSADPFASRSIAAELSNKAHLEVLQGWGPTELDAFEARATARPSVRRGKAAVIPAWTSRVDSQ